MRLAPGRLCGRRRTLTMPWMEPDQVHRISKALADRRRFEILERIASEKEVACAALVEELPLSQATISHHLKELASAGLVDVRREAKYGFY
jgi:ArsR family transcriptional regulator